MHSHSINKLNFDNNIFVFPKVFNIFLTSSSVKLRIGLAKTNLCAITNVANGLLQREKVHKKSIDGVVLLLDLQ